MDTNTAICNVIIAVLLFKINPYELIFPITKVFIILKIKLLLSKNQNYL